MPLKAAVLAAGGRLVGPRRRTRTGCCRGWPASRHTLRAVSARRHPAHPFAEFVETLVPPFIPFRVLALLRRRRPARGGLRPAGAGPPAGGGPDGLDGAPGVPSTSPVVRIGPLEWQGASKRSVLAGSASCWRIPTGSLGWSDPCPAMSARDRRVRREGTSRHLRRLLPRSGQRHAEARRGRRLPSRPRPSASSSYLVARAGQLVTKDELLDRLGRASSSATRC